MTAIGGNGTLAALGRTTVWNVRKQTLKAAASSRFSPWLRPPTNLVMSDQMPKIIAFLPMALVQSQPTEGREMLIATDQDLSTSVRLFETADAVRFEFTGPNSIVPSIAIDVQRNGVIDPAADFQVGFDDDQDEKPCLQQLISESESTDCTAPGEKADIIQSRRANSSVTTFSFPKRQISGDGVGFGFAISLWNKLGNHKTPLASGDYRFGGRLQLISDGPNFKGEAKSTLPPQILSAKRNYQACLWMAIKALEPLDQFKIAKLKAVPAGCAATRATALKEGVEALVASGAPKVAAEEEMMSHFGQVDTGIARLVEVLEKDP